MLFSPCLSLEQNEKMFRKFIICTEHALIIFAYSHEDKLNCCFFRKFIMNIQKKNFPVAPLLTKIVKVS